MSRRKHVTLDSLHEAVDPPGPGQTIVRALGGRGSNILEVELPDGTKTLARIPARFHKKLWIRNGQFLIVDHEGTGGEAAVEAEVAAVLYTQHVKELQRMSGVWPETFAAHAARGGGSPAEDRSAPDETDRDDEGEGGGEDDRGSDSDVSSSDSSLPPLEQIQNRRVVEYDQDSSDDSD